VRSENPKGGQANVPGVIPESERFIILGGVYKMAYLHCHNCGWAQDDFWSKEGYNPINHMLGEAKHMVNGILAEPNEISVDNWLLKEWGLPQTGKVKYTEFVARDLERRARNIRDMVYRTMKEFKQVNSEKKCPKCGAQELDID
jgi:hypothetical protein